MNYTPLARGRNFDLENLKNYLQLYKPEHNKSNRKDVEEYLEAALPGYLKTYYQNMSQFGLEYKEPNNGIFLYQEYLQNFNDEQLKNYIEFWFMIYFCPNYRVNSVDTPQILYISILKKLLSSENYTISYEDFSNYFFNHGSKDILENLIMNFGKYIYYEKNSKFFLNQSELEDINKLISFIETNFPIPKAFKSGIVFFERYSEKNYTNFINYMYKISEDSNSNEYLYNQFKIWLKNDYKNKGEPLAPESQKKYLTYLEKVIPSIFQEHFDMHINIFKIKDYRKINEFYGIFKKDLKEIDKKTSNAYSAALNRYSEFLINYLKNIFPQQVILYGAPGTGKSHYLDELTKNKQNNIERITFFDGYSNAQFIGSYKPVSRKNNITYEFVPGPIFRILENAYLNPEEHYYLIIEEINRGPADKIFGSTFQLLDRLHNGESQYPISLSEEQNLYLKEKLEDIYTTTIFKRKGLYFPSNLSIYATMNSGDQNVYPLDSAFKRRWDFKYITLNQNQNNFGENEAKYLVNIKNNKIIPWNIFRTAINNILLKNNIREDRLLAPFFLSPNSFEYNNNEYCLSEEKFESKILMYLFEDILRYSNKSIIFAPELLSFSDLLEKYRDSEANIFSENFYEELDNILVNM